MNGMNKLPSISIVMAAYNEGQTIGKAIESIIDQTFKDWELIVIDDGSIDNTTVVVNELSKKDNRIHLIKNGVNSGLPSSLNKGIKYARAKLIARADSDDINLPKRLELQYDFMQRNYDIDILGSGAFLVNQNSKQVKTAFLYQTHEDLVSQPFLKAHFFHPSVIIRKRFFESVGLYDETFLRVQDKELWLRGLRAGCRYANLSIPLIEYSTGGYIRSWQSIRAEFISLVRISHKYKIRKGIFYAFLGLLNLLLIKFRFRKL